MSHRSRISKKFLYLMNIHSNGLAIAVFILVGNWPDSIEVLMMSECWQNVIKTFKQKRSWHGIQSAGGKFGAFYHSMQL